MLAEDDDDSTLSEMDFATDSSPTGWDFLALQERAEKVLAEALTPTPLSCESETEVDLEQSVVFHVVTSTAVRVFRNNTARIVHSFPLHVATLFPPLASP